MRINWVKAAPWVCTIGLFAIWEAACWILEIAPYVLPPPSLIVEAVHRVFERPLEKFDSDALDNACGLWDRSCLWSSPGFVRGLGPNDLRGLYPLMVGFNSIPKVAVVPILVIWFGSGWIPAVLTAF